MRAFYIKEHAHPSKHRVVADAPEPIPAKDEVLVDVYSAGLNFFDILQAQGKYQIKPPLPFALGFEFAGRIAANSPIPPGCPFKPGERVFGGAQGAFAEKIRIGWAANILSLPDSISFNEAAGGCLYI